MGGPPLQIGQAEFMPSARCCKFGGRPALALSEPDWLGRLPGDLVIERENMTFYFPVMTCLALSAQLAASFLSSIVSHVALPFVQSSTGTRVD
jgi:hypothetical protein